jgi:hypothetical protein
MITNILRFQFRNDVNEEERRQALKVITRTASVEAVAFSSIGQYFGEDDYTHAYCVSLRDIAALDRYLHEPVHRAGDFQFIPLLARLSRMMVSDDPDPDLTAKIQECWSAAVDPEWKALFDRFDIVD